MKQYIIYIHILLVCIIFSGCAKKVSIINIDPTPSEEELLIINETNSHRSKKLNIDDKLMKCAKFYAMKMAQKRKLSHESKERAISTLTKRLKLFNFNYSVAGENIAFGQTPEQVVGEWMESPGHRENILNKEFNSIGVGAYFDGEAYWYCQVFGSE